MKYLIAIAIAFTFNLVLISCTKDKTPLEIVPADCSDTVKFSTQILPMINIGCGTSSCHDNGSSIDLNDYSTISSNASNMISRMKSTGSDLMPQGGPALHDSLIKQFECWMNQGKLNN